MPTISGIVPLIILTVDAGARLTARTVKILSANRSVPSMPIYRKPSYSHGRMNLFVDEFAELFFFPHYEFKYNPNTRRHTKPNSR